MYAAAALHPFETAREGFTEAAIADELRKIKDSVPEGPARQRWWAEWSAAMFREVDNAKSFWGTAFGPMAVLKNDAGDEVFVPDLKDADAATGLEPISWTLFEGRIRCPEWDQARGDGGRDDSSRTSSWPVRSDWCWMRARASARSPASWI